MTLLPFYRLWILQHLLKKKKKKQSTPHISLHALVRNAATETLRVSGTIKNKEIIIDGGSTPNLILDRVVKCRLKVSQSSNFQVMVRNGDKLHCNSFCSKVPITLYT